MLLKRLLLSRWMPFVRGILRETISRVCVTRPFVSWKLVYCCQDFSSVGSSLANRMELYRLLLITVDNLNFSIWTAQFSIWNFNSITDMKFPKWVADMICPFIYTRRVICQERRTLFNLLSFPFFMHTDLIVLAAVIRQDSWKAETWTLSRVKRVLTVHPKVASGSKC